MACSRISPGGRIKTDKMVFGLGDYTGYIGKRIDGLNFRGHSERNVENKALQ